MAKGKNSFVAYTDWGDIFDQLTDEEAGKVAKHLFDYVRDKNPEPVDRLTKVVFEPMKSQLKRDLKKWEDELIQKRDNGSLGNLKRWHNDLYLRVINKDISLHDALEEAERRKEKSSHPDENHRTPIESIAQATKSSQNIAVFESVTVTDNTINTVLTDEEKKFQKFEVWMKENAPSVLKLKEPITVKQYLSLEKSFSKDEIKETFLAMHNWKELLKKKVSANLTFRAFIKKSRQPITLNGKTLAPPQNKDCPYPQPHPDLPDNWWTAKLTQEQSLLLPSDIRAHKINANNNLDSVRQKMGI
jgi:hypothetical protein